MGEDLAIGDMGAADPFGLAIDVPEPQLQGADGMDAGLAGPGGIGASLADVGLAASAAPVNVNDGVAAAFSGDMDTVSFAGDALGSIPQIEAPDAPAGPEAFSSESFPAGSPSAFASSGVASLSDAPSSQEGIPGGLSGLPGIEPPLPAFAAFAGVATAPEEFLDLQMALSPPPPSQEGFPGASDAPMAAPADRLALESPGGFGGMSMAAMESISMGAWGAPGAASGAPGAAGGSSGPSIRIENLHLPATSPNEMLDQLLATAPDLTNADLSGLGAA
jgi:hypothetical protein